MAHRIRIRAHDVVLDATLNDSKTARHILETLPLTARGQRWGEEIYFEIPVDDNESEDARDVMDIGELAYWPPGRAFCIFFGRTPASKGDEPRAASAVNPIGRIEGDATVLSAVPNGSEIALEKL